MLCSDNQEMIFALLCWQHMRVMAHSLCLSTIAFSFAVASLVLGTLCTVPNNISPAIHQKLEYSAFEKKKVDLNVSIFSSFTF